MATYNIEDIVNKTLILLDEHKISDSLLDEDTYSFSIREMISERLLDAIKQVIARAPLAFFKAEDCSSFTKENKDGKDVARTITWDAKLTGVGSVELPNDFFRFIKYKMSDWDTPVYEVIDVMDEDYAMQRSPFIGVRGNAMRPVCAINIKEGNKVLEFYSSNDNKAKVSEALYIPYPSTSTVKEGDKQVIKVNIPLRCYDSVIYTIGAMVCFALKQQELGTVLNELSKSSMV